MSSLFFYFFIMHRGWDEREMQFRPSVCCTYIGLTIKLSDSEDKTEWHVTNINIKGSVFGLFYNHTEDTFTQTSFPARWFIV